MKPFGVGILRYAERICEMHDLAKYVPPPLIKKYEYYQADWAIHDK